MPKLLGNDASRDVEFYDFQDGDGGHFEYGTVAKLAIIFYKGAGAHFCLICFR